MHAFNCPSSALDQHFNAHFNTHFVAQLKHTGGIFCHTYKSV